VLPARDPALQVLLDKQEIREVMLRYCRAIDRCDREGVLAAFHPDAVEDHGPYQGDSPGFVEWAFSVLEKQVLTMHLVANQLIEVDGDVAHSETYLLALHRLERDGATTDWFLGARYVDRFARRDGAWKIAHRTTVHDWNRLDPLQGEWPGATDFAQGRRSLDDAAYRRA
jgi:ketosteroid isomerase-like protein